MRLTLEVVSVATEAQLSSERSAKAHHSLGLECSASQLLVQPIHLVDDEDRLLQLLGADLQEPSVLQEEDPVADGNVLEQLGEGEEAFELLGDPWVRGADQDLREAILLLEVLGEDRLDCRLPDAAPQLRIKHSWKSSISLSRI